MVLNVGNDGGAVGALAALFTVSFFIIIFLLSTLLICTVIVMCISYMRGGGGGEGSKEDMGWKGNNIYSEALPRLILFLDLSNPYPPQAPCHHSYS